MIIQQFVEKRRDIMIEEVTDLSFTDKGYVYWMRGRQCSRTGTRIWRVFQFWFNVKPAVISERQRMKRWSLEKPRIFGALLFGVHLLTTSLSSKWVEPYLSLWCSVLLDFSGQFSSSGLFWGSMLLEPLLLYLDCSPWDSIFCLKTCNLFGPSTLNWVSFQCI